MSQTSTGLEDKEYNGAKFSVNPANVTDTAATNKQADEHAVTGAEIVPSNSHHKLLTLSNYNFTVDMRSH